MPCNLSMMKAQLRLLRAPFIDATTPTYCISSIKRSLSQRRHHTNIAKTRLVSHERPQSPSNSLSSCRPIISALEPLMKHGIYMYSYVML